MKVTVQRSQWLRGEGEEDSCLYRHSDHTMCCLGFLCVSVGIEIKNLVVVVSPGELAILHPEEKHKIPAVLLDDSNNYSNDSGASIELMGVNDSQDLDEEQRESKICSLGREIGIEFEFVDGE